MTEFLSGLGVNMQPQFWISVIEIIWINVLLSGDNAIVIALACRGLAPNQRMPGMVLGTAAALIMRVAFTSIIATLMFVPYLKIVGGVALLWIAIKLVAPQANDEDNAPEAVDGLWRAVRIVLVADIVMSLDNVIAVAAAAKGNFAMLVFGLGISIPIIVGGATLIMAMLKYFPFIIWAGAALLGWVAGDVIATDSVVVDAAKALGPDAHERIEVVCAVVGATITLLGGWLSRVRHTRHVLTPPPAE